MDGLDIETREIVRVERQNPANAVDVHHGHKLRFMDLATEDAVSHDEPLPFPVDRRRIRQHRQEPLYFFEFGKRECDCKSQAVAGHGPRGDIPELRDILQGEIYRLGGSRQSGDAFDGECVAGMAGLGAP